MVPQATNTQDPEAERALLGAVLLDPEVLPRCSALVGSEDFHDPRNGLLWEAMLALHQRTVALDIHTLTQELRARERLHTVGGPQGLAELTDAVSTAAHCEAHARIVRDLARSRRAAQAFQDATRRLEGGAPLEAVRSEVDERLRTSQDPATGGLVAQDLDDLFTSVMDRLEGREKPLPTPWTSVDAVLGEGLWPGLYVLVGGTGAGKTQWAVQLAVHAARAGQRVLYLALELSRRDLAARVVGDLSGVPWSRFLRAQVTADELSQVMHAAREVEGLPLHTECAPPYGYGADALASRAWALRPKLVVLDYLQLCAGRGREEPRVTVGRVAYVARAIARDLGAVVLVLSSTARANYAGLVNDPSRDPADLVGLGKESGEIEYAADGVLVLARTAERPDARVLVVAKNRHGPVGRAELTWSGTTFTMPADDGPPVDDPSEPDWAI